MNKIFQLLLVAYVAFYLLDSRGDELKDTPVCGNVNTISANNSAPESAGCKSSGIKSEGDVINATTPLLQFVEEPASILNSNTASTRYYRKDETVASSKLFLPKHLLVN